MTIPIYTMPRVPGATNTTSWSTFCHSKEPFIVINHDTLRNASRWTYVERKKPFEVIRYDKGKYGLRRSPIGWFATLEKAEAAARKAAKEEKIPVRNYDIRS